MPVVLMEGCRVIPGTFGLVRVANAQAGTTTWERVASRTGWGFQNRNSSAIDSANYRGLLILAPRAAFTGTDFSLGFAVKHPDPAVSPATSFNASVAATGGGSPFSFSANTVSTISVNPLSGMAAVEILDSTPTSQGWHWWCLTGRMNLSSGGWYRLYRDGNLIARIEGDTNPTGSGQGNLASVTLAVPPMNNPSGCILSDVILRDDANIIPESRVDVLLPRSNASVAWTPSAGANWDCVNDEPTISTADFVSSSTVGATDLYNFDPLPYTPTSIGAVMLTAQGSKSDAGVRTMTTVINGTEGTALDPGLGGAQFVQVAATNPSGGSAWTKATVDAIQAGVRVKT